MAGSKVSRVTLNRKGVTALLRGAEIAADLARRAEAVVAATGLPADAYRIERESGKNRARVAIITDDHRSRRAESKSGNLRGALTAGKR